MKKILLTSLLLLVILSGCAGLADSIGDMELAATTDEPSPLPTDREGAAEPGEITEPSPSPEEAVTPPEEDAQEESQTGKSHELPHRSIVELAVRDLALRLDLDPAQIQILAVESVEWPDAGLGCPLPGMNYAQVITPGYRITLEAAGKTYVYHTNTESALILCLDDGPQLPVFPVDPDEIQDGEPWMPVDPLPTLIEGKDNTDPEPIK